MSNSKSIDEFSCNQKEELTQKIKGAEEQIPVIEISGREYQPPLSYIEIMRFKKGNQSLPRIENRYSGIPGSS